MLNSIWFISPCLIKLLAVCILFAYHKEKIGKLTVAGLMLISDIIGVIYYLMKLANCEGVHILAMLVHIGLIGLFTFILIDLIIEKE